ncbi:10867_t:CDS:1, partial [Ambispora gerdemannii]
TNVNVNGASSLILNIDAKSRSKKCYAADHVLALLRVGYMSRKIN